MTDMPFDDADLRACLGVLTAIEADRGVLTRLTQAERRELLTLAGLIAKPDGKDLRRMAKAFRRAERGLQQQQDRQALERAGLRQQRRSETYAPLWLPPPESQAPDERAGLSAARACYVCKQPYTSVHRYYDSMCQACGRFNYGKREQTANLDGRFALVTGARA